MMTKLRDIPRVSEYSDYDWPHLLTHKLHIPDAASSVDVNTEMIEELNRATEFPAHVLGEYDGKAETSHSTFAVDDRLRLTGFRELLSTPPISRTEANGYCLVKDGEITPVPVLTTNLNRQYIVRAVSAAQNSQVSAEESWRRMYEKTLRSAYLAAAAWRLTEASVKIVVEKQPDGRVASSFVDSVTFGSRSWLQAARKKSMVRSILRSGDLVTLADS
jgi:hypothetical protein